MGQLIDDLLGLSRLTRARMTRKRVDLSAIAEAVLSALVEAEPSRTVSTNIAPGLVVRGDDRLLRVALENLLRNAWKFTADHSTAHIAFGSVEIDGEPVFFVRDDGAGFDMAYQEKLFRPFQRLHGVTEFEGTGIGLAIVQRIVHRHGGRVWADAQVERGATFYFTLDSETTAGLPEPQSTPKVPIAAEPAVSA